ncbi:hypothetical protein [Flavihumibacter petaseus]|uniref:Uncharacterized protein n=1 Tax=Flavihumibacter petaseus NBRC 106054 TaxID=1220578 RepID=A0A0E9N117_9BACT|nr:hypothetical protein [Flavihumibacter petaseus]GAO43356.1 hypothetical protein FPE01S_02_04610 [Flavihumibacter petaseus NBRC 106054]
MKKGWIRWALLAIVIIASIAAAFFLTDSREQVISINATPFDVMQKLTDSNSYHLWLPEKFNHQVTLRQVSASTVVLSTYDNQDSIHYTFEIIPVTRDHACEVKIAGSPEKQTLYKLKALMEDPAWRYGFEIRPVAVSDSLILTLQRVGQREKSDSIANVLSQSLYKTLKQLPGEEMPGYCFVSKVSLANGLVETAVGVPVKKRPAQAGESKVLALPSRGKLLVGKSSLEKKSSLQQALNNYIYDQRMKRVAVVMDKFPVRDGAIIRDPKQELEVIVPVY